MASTLINQAYALIDTCKTAIASPVKQARPAGSTISQARSIIDRARQSKTDPILKGIEISDSADWPDVLAAMQTVVRTVE